MVDGDGFLEYHEPGIVQILVILSFFLFLSISQWLAANLLRAGLLGQIITGIIYGKPLGNILRIEWQETFIALGYIGLVLIIFEGGLGTRLDLFKSSLITSAIAAAIGSATPIALSYLLLYLGFSFGAIETFIVGAALSSTSLGTTMVVLKQAGNDLDMTQTRAGTILLSAAVIDDVAGLVMASVIQSLGRSSHSGEVNLGWLIGRPIVASVVMAIATPLLLAKFLLAPAFRRFGQNALLAMGDAPALIIMTAVLCAFVSIASYAGTSVLYGAFLAGMFLSYLPRKATGDGPELNFEQIFEKFVSRVLRIIFEPLFFASIGFAIPFLKMWAGRTIWQGVIFSLLMVIGKVVVGLCLPFKTIISHLTHVDRGQVTMRSKLAEDVTPALLVGLAMVARGEIGLLIIQIGFNDTDYLSQQAFVVAIWAIVVNTMVGPMLVGFLMKSEGRHIADSYWGIVRKGMPSMDSTRHEDGRNRQRRPPECVMNGSA